MISDDYGFQRDVGAVTSGSYVLRQELAAAKAENDRLTNELEAAIENLGEAECELERLRAVAEAAEAVHRSGSKEVTVEHIYVGLREYCALGRALAALKDDNDEDQR